METAEQKIIKFHQTQSIGDKRNVSCLEDIEKYMTDYDLKQNSMNKFGDTIKCGETREFNCYGDILIGKIYHNINNMWWCITDEHTYRNIPDHNILEKVGEL